MALVRVRYRRKPIQPEFVDGKENVTLSLAKKEKPVEEDPYGESKATSWEDPVYLPQHTQKQRMEVIVSSNEEKYRRKQYPTIYERIADQKAWAKEQLNQAKIAQQKVVLKEKQQQLAALAAKGDTAGMESLEEEMKDIFDEEEAADKEAANGDLAAMKSSYELQLLDIKEKKIVSSRNTQPFHHLYSRWHRHYRALRTSLGFFASSGGQAQDRTVILPWLLLGRRETASSLALLLSLNVTHILNMTESIPNYFENHFIYEKIPIHDDPYTADIGFYFKRIIGFMKRCEDCNGRILVHCTAGASRAPTAVIAYLVYRKGIALVDAYNYVTFLRPQVRPNTSFLMALTILEVEMGQGCSVYYHRDWRFYEFNVFRGEQVPDRRGKGVYATTYRLYSEEHMLEVPVIDMFQEKKKTTLRKVSVRQSIQQQKA